MGKFSSSHLINARAEREAEDLPGIRTRFPKANRNLPALKAPAHVSPGQRPGFRYQPIARRPKRAKDSSALSGRTILCGTIYRMWDDIPGALPPGLYPPRRWRDIAAVN